MHYLFSILWPMLLVGLLAGFFWLAEKTFGLIEKLPAWARWILLLPCAVLFAFLALFPLHWYVQIQLANPAEDDWISASSWATIELFASWFVVPFAFISSGASVAPRGRMVTAIILVAVVLIGASLLGYLISVWPDLEFHQPWKLVTTTVLLLLGISTSVYYVAKIAKK